MYFDRQNPSIFLVVFVNIWNIVFCSLVWQIFTLSAIPFAIMPSTIEQCVCVLKPGGLLLFRDYGLYDMTMLRFLPDQRVGFREYMRSDDTLSYFFTLDTVRELFHAAGLIELELEYCCVRSVNRKKNWKKMQRVWVHGKFLKPPSWRWQTVNVVCQQTSTAVAILYPLLQPSHSSHRIRESLMQIAWPLNSLSS